MIKRSVLPKPGQQPGRRRPVSNLFLNPSLIRRGDLWLLLPIRLICPVMLIIFVAQSAIIPLTRDHSIPPISQAPSHLISASHVGRRVIGDGIALVIAPSCRKTVSNGINVGEQNKEPRDFRKMRHAGPSVSASDIPNFPTTNLISTDADAMMMEPEVAPDLSKVEVLPKKLDRNQPDRITSDHKSLQEVLMASRATSTVAKYRKAFEDGKSWCAINCVCELPAQKADIARYYMSMYNNDAPYSRIEGAHFGIKWVLDCSPVTEVNPCNSRFLHLLLAGLKRILAHPKCKKERITPDILNKLVSMVVLIV
ncbi:uncharacterized protein LOC115918175 [Strongylocentrotus purpuratus]|uniref:Uncharacterized protein n=1 Tax=Strongylocentrotus purpuratus TaxID=7668 RepID=A0A7M7P275_STRPU|nr:uncharacterized protein LOC115918175 [Strongylocentrotus purpuratus]